MLGRKRFAAGQQPSEYRDLIGDSSTAKLDAFLDASHGEFPRSRLGKRRGYVDSAVSVGVGLDYSQDLGSRACRIPDCPKIPLNRAQIHLGERTHLLQTRIYHTAVLEPPGA